MSEGHLEIGARQLGHKSPDRLVEPTSSNVIDIILHDVDILVLRPFLSIGIAPAKPNLGSSSVLRTTLS